MTDGPCPHCGSPALFRPCWYEAPGYPENGGDPPCLGDLYDIEHAERRRDRNRMLLSWSVGLTLVALIIGSVMGWML